MGRVFRSLMAGAGVFALVLVVPVTAALAQEEPVLTNTETVNVTLDATGGLQVARVFDQIAIQGSGEVSYRNPVSTSGLRNLDGFGGFTVEDGAIVEETSVNSQVRRRTLSDFDLDLPVTVAITHTLDGEELAPADVVGKTGELEVTYRVENMTGETEEIEYTNAQGETDTVEEKVSDPMAGSLTMTLPSNYTDVKSESGAVIAGDGRGGTKLSFSVTLIPPLGEPVAEVSYTAHVENAVIPEANLTIVPVVVDANPTVSGAKESFEGGAETGRELAAGATEIDANVLKLADGASDLVEGLILLRDGSGVLSAGLVNDAAPGANELADGAGQLSDGLNELQSQVPALIAGVIQLDQGGNRLEAGLQQLQGSLPALNAGVAQLVDGAKQLEAGLLQLQSQIPALKAGVASLLAGAQQLSGGLNALEAGLDAPLPNGFGAGLKALSDGLSTLPATVAALKTAVAGIAQTDDCGPSACQQTVSGVVDQITSQEPSIKLAADTAAKLYGGYAAPITNNPPGIRATIGALSDGVDRTNPPGLLEGLKQLNAQLPAIEAGVNKLVAGATTLRAGLEKLQASAAPLSSGVAGLAAGATQLSDGLSELRSKVSPLSDGVNVLADGGGQLAAGAGQLADGLGNAADGSVQLASGLGDAAEAAPALPEGATRLSKEGTSQLVKAGEETAQDFAGRVATLEAGAERTADGGLPYGAPEDALRFAAYSYDINGASGSTSQNAGRLIAGLAIGGGAAVGAGLMAARRKSA